MKVLNELLNELGISKVRLAKYLGVSRQMLYNYLAMNNLKEWPKEKATKLMSLLNIKEEAALAEIKVDGSYIMEVEERLNEGVKDSSDRDVILSELKGFSKKEQELLSDIINYLKEKLSEDTTKEAFHTFTYLYHYLQSMDSTPELKYILAYMSKSMGFTEPMEFVFNQDKQFVLESVLFTGLSFYNNGNASKTKLAETHKRFVADIEHKNEEKLSRTQELNTFKILALRELGYSEITGENAKEVLEKIAEIQSRKV